MTTDIYSRSAYVDSEYVDMDEDDQERLKKKIDLGDFKYATNKRARAKGSSHSYHPRSQLQSLADRKVRLVPIRLDLTIDDVKLRDAFTWNLNETLLTPEKFATLLAEDFDSPLAPQFIPLIASAIREQVAAYAGASDDDGAPEATEEAFEQADDEEYDEDFRIVIKLDLHVGSLHLKDQFEWPLYSSYTVSPEDFARQLAADLGVGGEFVPHIAHAIREQVCLARINFHEATEAPPVHGRPFRHLATMDEDWEPELRELTEQEREKIAKEKERNSRRMRRSAIQVKQRTAQPPSTLRQTSSFYAPQNPPTNYTTPAHSQRIQSSMNPYTPAFHPGSSQNPYSTQSGGGSMNPYQPVSQRRTGPTQSNMASTHKMYSTPPSMPGGYTARQGGMVIGDGTFGSLVAQKLGAVGAMGGMSLVGGGGTDSGFGAGSPVVMTPGYIPGAYQPYSTYPAPSPYTPGYPYGPTTTTYPPPQTPTGYHQMQVPYSANPSVLYGQHMNEGNGSGVGGSVGRKRSRGVVDFDPERLKRQVEMMQRTVRRRDGSGGMGTSEDNSGSGTPESGSSFGEGDAQGGGKGKGRRKHRGFGASANLFNADGSVDVGEFRRNWRCSWCCLSGKYTPTLRKGPLGPKSVCNACGIWYSKHGVLPEERYQEHVDTV
ncbi:hypothetical protein HK097_007755 [Rhizophlyctis rosea]|uniref:GATA-type domain-containing protein n=1 Tax=Rhizophlyctis rosea TaxID=64517 RepID=A0AAD5SCQ4_9FUNG|nr:hypothetical protein HK097_007755 [Rhizophlyctis rosea]